MLRFVGKLSVCKPAGAHESKCPIDVWSDPERKNNVLAITRNLSRKICDCELTFLQRQPIDFERAAQQQEAYRNVLKSLGLEVIALPADDRYPDCCFVEDAAVVLDEVAVITRMGSETRRGEGEALLPVLKAHRRIARMEAPATLDGGDVVQVGRRLLVGLSSRTNQDGVNTLREILGPFGYTVTPVPVHGVLHLKSACTALDDETLIVEASHIDLEALAGLRMVRVPPEEAQAADVLQIGQTICIHAGYERTINLLQKRGMDVRTVDVSEFLKAEAGVTCLSVILNHA
jgi:dimethylargininase